MKGYYIERARVYFTPKGVHLEIGESEVTIQLRDLDLVVEMLLRQGNDLTGYKNQVHTTDEAYERAHNDDH
jgi:hypothetical protein